MHQQLRALPVDADLLFLDDNSPDGTGEVLDAIAAADPKTSIIHRTGKLGIGSAHQEGIAFAYREGYETLVTMDCDFTHSPADVLRLLAASADADVTLGSRYMKRGSLPGWNPMRRSLTWFGHFLTVRLLKMHHDATGAFRIYNLQKIPHAVFGLVRARGYAFFFESLFVLFRNGMRIAEVPIVLPARTYGTSKMSWREAARSGRQVFDLYAATKFNAAPLPFAV